MTNALGKPAAGITDKRTKELGRSSLVRLAVNVFARRSKLGITQEELSKRSGIAVMSVKRAEKAATDSPLSKLDALAHGLKCEAWELIK